MVERITLRRIKNSEELVLDMVSTPDFILKSVDWGSIKGTHHSYKYVNQIGESIENTSLGPRPINIEGWIVAKDKNQMNSLKRRLNSFVNPKEEYNLFYNDYVINFVPDETVKYTNNRAENNDAFSKFQIVGTAPNPLFSDNFENKLSFVMTSPEFHFPLVMSSELPDEGIVFGKRSVSLITSATNNGSVSIGMRIIFRANGTVVNPSLINVDTLEEFKINKTMVANEEIEINTNIGEKRVRGKIGENNQKNYFMYKDINSKWLQLEVGDNLFRYDAESGINNLDVFIYYYNRYLEVQECD